MARLVPCLALLHQGFSGREMLGSAALLSAPLTLMVAISALGADLKVLDANGVATLIVLAVATGVVFPVVFRLVTGRGRGETQER